VKKSESKVFRYSFNSITDIEETKTDNSLPISAMNIHPSFTHTVCGHEIDKAGLGDTVLI
jgi:hypothetical protein